MRALLVLVLVASLCRAADGPGDSSPPATEEAVVASQSGEPPSKDDATALELGRQVLAIRKALENPGAPDAMQAVTELGHDTRGYVMVRGWLAYQLQGDESILEAAREKAPQAVRDRVAFLRRAIRILDLE